MHNTHLIKISAVALLAVVSAAPAFAADSVTTHRATRTQTTTRVAAFAAPSERGVYLAGQAGWNKPTRDDGTLNDAAVFAGAVGYRFDPHLRLEGELAYRRNGIDGDGVAFGHTKIANAMVNAYYDFANTSPVTPYVGFGAGLAYGKGRLDVPVLGFSGDESDTAFAWQGIAGLAYTVAQNIDLTADYRYLDTANFSDIGDDYSAHEVRAGLRYSF